MASEKPLRDWVYLAIASTQLFGMLVLDLVQFYPKALYADPFSPLHFLTTLRQTYVSLTGDPFFATHSYAPWSDSMLLLEGLVQLPAAAYFAWNLASKKPTSGPAELAGLVFGCLTAMGSLAFCAELWSMGTEVVSQEQKMRLVFGTYGPFLVIPGVLAADMYLRLLSRVQASDTKAKTQ